MEAQEDAVDNPQAEIPKVQWRLGREKATDLLQGHGQSMYDPLKAKGLSRVRLDGERPVRASPACGLPPHEDQHAANM